VSVQIGLFFSVHRAAKAAFSGETSPHCISTIAAKKNTMSPSCIHQSEGQEKINMKQLHLMYSRTEWKGGINRFNSKFFTSYDINPVQDALLHDVNLLTCRTHTQAVELFGSEFIH
jgi:hypothetical protein